MEVMNIQHKHHISLFILYKCLVCKFLFQMHFRQIFKFAKRTQHSNICALKYINQEQIQQINSWLNTKYALVFVKMHHNRSVSLHFIR